jgi:cytochrome P450
MDQAAYMPFGTGPHICIGETAAKLIMRRTIPAICRKFRVESCARGVVPVLIRIVALPLRPPQVVLRAR